MTRERMPTRQASTLILLRDTADGPQVFMQRRAPGAAFLGGAYVFPGGALEAADAAIDVANFSDAQASERLSLASGGLAYWIAAVRECFEESGILVARQANGSCVDAERVAAMARERGALNRHEITFADVLARNDLQVAADELVYFDHWVTPANRPRRFDTRFFIARTPPGQHGAHDDAEAVHSVWLRPDDALARAARGDIDIAFATRFVLNELATFASVDAALAHARAKGPIVANRPVVAQGRDGERTFRRGDAAYAEIHWSDPDETTQTTYDLVPGTPKRLDRFVTRLIAPNPGMMTGPGTNTYLVGDDELAVIDPGPAIDAHVEAILAQGRERIRWIVCTHTHRDHSPAARAIKAATGACIVGRPPPGGASQDTSFAPDRVPAHGERLRIGGVTLRAVHTPGHASNHVCYLLDDTRMLFSGDHVMQGSTVVINPPDGDMRAYLQSLEALLAEDIAIIAPGHGYLIGAPQREIRRLIEHRTWRERKVIEALASVGAVTCEELVPIVYDDAPPALHPVAQRSLLAHLRKLIEDGRAAEANGRYRRA